MEDNANTVTAAEFGKNGVVIRKLYKEAHKMLEQGQEKGSIVSELSKKYNLDGSYVSRKLDERVFNPTQPEQEPITEDTVNADKYEIDGSDSAETSIGRVLGIGSGQARATKRPIRLVKQMEDQPSKWSVVFQIYSLPVDWDWVQKKHGGGAYIIEELIGSKDVEGNWHPIKDASGHPMMPYYIAKTLEEQRNPTPVQPQNTIEQATLFNTLSSSLKNVMEISLKSQEPSREIDKLKFEIMDKSHAREMQLQEKMLSLQNEMTKETLKRYDERFEEQKKNKGTGGLISDMKELAGLKDQIKPLIEMFGYKTADPLSEEKESKFWNFMKGLTNNPLFVEKLGEGVSGLMGGFGLLMAGFASKIQNKGTPAPSTTTPKQVEAPQEQTPSTPVKVEDIRVQKYQMMIKELEIIVKSRRFTYDQYLWFMEGMEIPMFYPVQIAKLDEFIEQLNVAYNSHNQEQLNTIGAETGKYLTTAFDFSKILFLNEKDEITEDGSLFVSNFVKYSLPQAQDEAN